MVELLLIFLLCIVALLALSAFFSSAETALTGASHPRIHTLAKGGDLKAERVDRLWEDRENTLGSILLGNNLVNILASALATALFIRLFGDIGVLIATVVMTVVVVIFAEILPKTVALRSPTALVLRVGEPLAMFVAFVRPIAKAIQSVTQRMAQMIAGPLEEDAEEASEQALLGAIDLHSDEIEATDADDARDARDMMRSILDLDDVTVEEIMTHRKEVEMLNLDDPTERNVAAALKSPYTRLPLYKEDADNLVGVLHAKALLRAMHAQKQDPEDQAIDLAEFAKEPWFVPEHTMLIDQLRAFRTRREHFALVVDEYGAFQGIVTLEDILEEIVGDIADEHDIAVDGIYPQVGGNIIVDGSVSIRDLNRRFEWSLPDEKASTIAGLVLYESRQIPEVGQVFDLGKFRFRILKRQRNQITSVSIRPLGS